MTLVFKPIGLLSGILAGLIGKKLFGLLWGLVDDQGPPEPKYRRIALGKLAGALILEGAIFRLARGFAEHGGPPGLRGTNGRVARRRTPTERGLMTPTEQLARIAPYLGRLLEDEYIEDQIGQAATQLRRSSKRVKLQSAGEVIKDQRLLGQLRAAARSLTAAGCVLKKPPRAQRGPLRAAALMLTGAGIAGTLVWRTKSTSSPRTTP